MYQNTLKRQHIHKIQEPWITIAARNEPSAMKVQSKTSQKKTKTHVQPLPARAARVQLPNRSALK
jgi:hypothetical protein